MSKTRKHKPHVPKAAAPVAKSVALRCYALRTQKGLTVEEAAAQLGIKVGHYVYLEQGRLIPHPKLAKRLYLWATTGETFTEPLGGEAHYTGDKEWPKVRIRIPPQESRQFKEAAQKMGMSLEQFFYFAGRMLLQNGRALLTVKDAVREAHWTASVQALQDINLRYFLQADLDLLQQAGVHAPAEEEAVERPMLEKFLEVEEPQINGPLQGEEEVEEIE